MNVSAQLIVLVASTFASEDLTCIAAGELVGRGELDWFLAILACFIGIFVGDLSLWLIGRSFGRRVLELAWVRKRIAAERFERLESWFDRNAGTAILSARFVPGLRLPMFLAAGAVGRRADRFAWWAFWAALLWTPLLVLGVALLGDAVLGPLKRYLGAGWPAVAAAVVIWYLILRSVGAMLSPIGRAKVVARGNKLWRWEFWPPYVFYQPVLLWILYLALRYRGFTTITAVNPGIPHSGFVGESKYDILRSIRSQHVVRTERIHSGDTADRIAAFRALLCEGGWEFPLVFKPDAGQRGAGVRVVKSVLAGDEYLSSNEYPVIVQPFHPGPYEAGIFYTRHPSQARGRIFSITDKRFPELTGDGRSTIEELIWRHPRFRFQAAAFLARHRSIVDRVLSAGQKLPLAVAGNHCQGTMFKDGFDLITPELERAIDSIARRFDGFYFGRFDVRYRDVDAFRRGEDLTVIELNGVTSEATNIYDPDRSLLAAYRTLFRQWRIAFEIGEANCRRGERRSTFAEIARATIGFYSQESGSQLSD
jgi:membrane protein DedA with SNARE-associated domain